MKKLLYLTAALTLMLSACKKKDQSVTPPLTITSLQPNSGLGGTLVTIYGKGFGPDTLTNLVTFNGLKAPIFEVTDTSLVMVAPASGTTGPVVVKAGGQDVTAGTYTYQLLSLHSASPLNGPAGTNVVITGAGLSGKSGPASVTFNGRQAIVVSSNDTSLVASVPDSAGIGPIVVTVDGSTATGPNFTYQVISFITPLTGGAGTQDSIHGSGFGTDASKDNVQFDGIQASIIAISDTMIVATVPSAVKTGPVAILINGQKTVGPIFTVVPPPVISSISPTSGLPGAQVVVTGKNFNTIQAQNQVRFNGTLAAVTAATATQLTVTVPTGATTGNVGLSINGQQAQGPVFTVQILNITALTPNNGLDGTPVVITGNGFSATPASNQVFFNGLSALVTAATTTQLTVTAPTGFTTGPITVKSSGLMAMGPVFSRAGVQTLYFDASKYLTSIAVDGSGNIYFTASSLSTNRNLNNIMKMSSNGTGLTVFAGSPVGTAGEQDGSASTALFTSPNGLVFDQQGNLYVSDGSGTGSTSIRMITPSGQVSTVVTTGSQFTNGIGFGPQDQTYITNSSGLYALTGGVIGTSLIPNNYEFGGPTNMAVDGLGNIYYTPSLGGGILIKVTNGAFSVLTTSLTQLYIARDPSTGNITAADQYSYSFYTWDESTSVQTELFAGNPAGANGPVDGTLAQATFAGVKAVAIDQTGALYIIDGGNQNPSYIRKITLH